VYDDFNAWPSAGGTAIVIRVAEPSIETKLDNSLLSSVFRGMPQLTLGDFLKMAVFSPVAVDSS
jgi:hypothetical protein